MKKTGRKETMNILRPRNVTPAELALIAVTRGAIGFGAGLLLADRFKGEQRKTLGWSLFLTGLVSTIPIAIRIFAKNERIAGPHNQ
jgi:hypothetical protein